MKKTIKILLAIWMMLLLVACGNANVETSEGSKATQEPVEEGAKLKVVTSFYPMYDFASKIGGDKAEVVNMVPVGAEAHGWEPEAKDMAELENADIFIYNGAGMEGWVDKVVSALSTDKLMLVEASSGLDLLENDHDHDHEDDHDHDHDHEDDHDHDHNHEEGHHHHHHGKYDPHVWLGIKNAKKQLENIKDAFVAKDPENKAYYEANYEKYAAEFDALDAKYAEEIGKIENKNLVVSHAAFGYIARDYGLKQIGIEGIYADSEPDAGRMAEIIDFVKENQVKTIYFEELISPKVAESIAKQTGAKTAMLNPLEGLSQEDLDAGEDYLSVMEKNLKTIVEGQ